MSDVDTTRDDSLEHCINSLIGIVRYEYAFENDPVKKARQVARGRSAKKQAKSTLEKLLASSYNQALDDLLEAMPEKIESVPAAEDLYQRSMDLGNAEGFNNCRDQVTATIHQLKSSKEGADDE